MNTLIESKVLNVSSDSDESIATNELKQERGWSELMVLTETMMSRWLSDLFELPREPIKQWETMKQKETLKQRDPRDQRDTMRQRETRRPMKQRESREPMKQRGPMYPMEPPEQKGAMPRTQSLFLMQSSP